MQLKLLLLTAGLSAGAGYAFYYGCRAWRKSRLVEDTPTSRVRSAVQGYVEIAGRGAPLPNSKNRGPLTGIPCPWWRYTVEERNSSGRSRSWSAVHSGTSEEPFVLDDGTGRCLIDPRGAEVYPAQTSVWYGPTEWPEVCIPNGQGLFGRLADLLVTDRYRYTEHRLATHEIVYGIGAFRSLGHAQDSELATTQLLHEWKLDQARLLQRFDVDRDGVLSSDEWEQARAAAHAQVLATLAAAPVAPRLDSLAKPTDGRPFLLSTLDQASLVRRLRVRAFGGIAICIGGTAAAAWIVLRVW